jgi:hypothetical protein
MVSDCDNGLKNVMYSVFPLAAQASCVEHLGKKLDFKVLFQL